MDDDEDDDDPNDSMSSSTSLLFYQRHRSQLEALHLTRPQLYEDLQRRLEALYHGESTTHECNAAATCNASSRIRIVPHVCSWTMRNSHLRRGLSHALAGLSTADLEMIHSELQAFWNLSYENPNPNLNHKDPRPQQGGKYQQSDQQQQEEEEEERRLDFIQGICDPRVWSLVILYPSFPPRHTDQDHQYHNNDHEKTAEEEEIIIRAALPAPPYYRPVISSLDDHDNDNDKDNKDNFDNTQADLIGPFPFQYHKSATQGELDDTTTKVIDTSLMFVRPGVASSSSSSSSSAFYSSLTRDVAPKEMIEDTLTRAVRYVAFGLDETGGNNSNMLSSRTACRLVREYYHNYVQQHHIRLHRSVQITVATKNPPPLDSTPPQPQQVNRIWRVYTDSGDPMGLAHTVSGLTDPHFELVSTIEEADIVFSYQSLFVPPGSDRINQALQRKKKNSNSITCSSSFLYLNQFPYEGAFVQKDHLARELWNQNGSPMSHIHTHANSHQFEDSNQNYPAWILESYDLDVQFAAFVGANLAFREAQEEASPVWIVKPSHGTQSKGHVVTRSLAQICHLLDADRADDSINGSQSYGDRTDNHRRRRKISRVAQRYVEKPLCVHGRKVDCRVIVLMSDATPGRPTLYMHKRVFLRIAHKPHSIETPIDLMDPEIVLTATHLLSPSDRTSSSSSNASVLDLLPRDTTTICALEEAYGFVWTRDVLPKIHTLVKELFTGMTWSFPGMNSPYSRAVYGVDVMFQVSDGSSSSSSSSKAVSPSASSTIQIEPKLLEVTFCPANNAICDAYERDDALYKSYLNDVFNCLFRGVVNERHLTPLL